MNDLISILKSGNANVKLEVSGEDLLEFSNELINRAKSELSAEYAEARKEKYLTKEEVKRMCEVCCDTVALEQEGLSESNQGRQQSSLSTVRCAPDFGGRHKRERRRP